MKDKIDQIFTDLKNEVITEKEAHNRVLLLFSVSGQLPPTKEEIEKQKWFDESAENRKKYWWR